MKNAEVKKRTTKKIESKEDKVAAGFDPDSTWGVPFDSEKYLDPEQAQAFADRLAAHAKRGS